MEAKLKQSFHEILIASGNIFETIHMSKSSNLILPNNQLVSRNLTTKLNDSIEGFNSILDDFNLKFSDVEISLAQLRNEKEKRKENSLKEEQERLKQESTNQKSIKQETFKQESVKLESMKSHQSSSHQLHQQQVQQQKVNSSFSTPKVTSNSYNDSDVQIKVSPETSEISRANQSNDAKVEIIEDFTDYLNDDITMNNLNDFSLMATNDNPLSANNSTSNSNRNSKINTPISMPSTNTNNGLNNRNDINKSSPMTMGSHNNISNDGFGSSSSVIQNGNSSSNNMDNFNHSNGNSINTNEQLQNVNTPVSNIIYAPPNPSYTQGSNSSNLHSNVKTNTPNPGDILSTIQYNTNNEDDYNVNNESFDDNFDVDQLLAGAGDMDAMDGGMLNEEDMNVFLDDLNMMLD